MSVGVTRTAGSELRARQIQPANARFLQPGPSCGRGKFTTKRHVLLPTASWREQDGQVRAGRGRGRILRLSMPTSDAPSGRC
jgi:hypothetical protein